MDLVDLMIEKRFLGQEFLTWLWYKSEERGGGIELPGSGDVMVHFEKHLLLEYGEGDSFEKLICQGLRAELNEARTGLKVGKKIEQARILLGRGEYQWNMTIKGSMFDFKSVKTPKTMTQSEESDDPTAVEGRLLEKIGLHEEALQIFNDLFRLYLDKRLSNDWPAELDRVGQWIHQPV